MKKRSLLLCAFAVLAGALLYLHQKQSQPKQPRYILRYSDNQSKDYPTTQGGLYFAELVEKRTNGDVKIIVYDSGTLGDEASVIRQVQFGGIDLARVSSAQLIVHEPSMAVLSLPYLYRNSAHMWKVLDGDIGDYFLKQVENCDLIGLSWYDAGARNFYSTKRPLTTLSDLFGLSVRTQEADFMEDFITALGATPDSLPYNEVYTSLSTGAVDAAENNWPSYESAQHYKVAPYVLEDNHIRIPELQILSQRTAATLPADYLEIIRTCAKESSYYERKLWQKQETQSRKNMLDAGVQIFSFSLAERQRFADACEPLYRQYGAGYEDLIARIEQTQ